jgi:predicted RND superfamily exporter protein
VGRKITDFSIRYPKTVIVIALLVTAVSLLRVTSVKIDTDPENMLSETEWVRVFHNEVKRDFTLSDMIVLGVVNEGDQDGVFNPETLSKIYRVTEGIKGIEGVVVQDLMALSTVDDILQAGPGTVRFQYLMEKPPDSREGALHIRDRVKANPLLDGTLVSEDGKALAIYIPIEKKSIAHRVSQEVSALIAAEPPGSEAYHFTGLPVAEDTFGVQMFQQMAISAPLAGLLIFLLMLFFFRKLILVISPMVVAMLTVAITMGILIATGQTVHIMSSMIPIFLMPIAVVDSVHILSDFFDRYQHYRDREKAIKAVMEDLFTPMLYTSLTTMVGFASLLLAPIPPVRVFGVFVALGVFLAWILTVTIVPAYVMLFIPERKLANFGVTHREDDDGHSPLARLLVWSNGVTRRWSRTVLVVVLLILGVSIYGITLIQINDNPVKWFVKDHPVRVADDVLNNHFGGTYEAFLVFEPEVGREALREDMKKVARFLDGESEASGSVEMADIVARLRDQLVTLEVEEAESPRPSTLLVIEKLLSEVDKVIASAPDEDENLLDDLYLMAEGLEDLRISFHTFKDPEVLRWVERFQRYLTTEEVVGKTNGLTEVVKKVHMELFEGQEEQYRIPDTPAAVAQTILSYQGSHDPEDVWHFVTPDFRRLNLWAQLKSGDNRDMERVVEMVEDYVLKNPPPVTLNHAWAGLTYLNVVWQDRMVKGMLRSLLSSFGIVLLMMTFLFRSISWGVLSMIPLTVTITLIYGATGLVGKDYDMVMAVLSSLTLGLSIDFAIHYIQRTRQIHAEKGSWSQTAELMSGAPARAITRNAIIIAMGFLPLLLANLSTYISVGILLAIIMIVSGGATLVIIPALIQNLDGWLFRKETTGH